jgi:tricorn protease
MSPNLKEQYFKYPAQSGKNLYLVSHQSLFLWKENHLSRLCSFDSDIKHLRTIDSNTLSFFSREETNGDIYTYEISSAKVQRMTFFDDPNIYNIGHHDGKLLFSSSKESPFISRLYSVDLATKECKLLYKDCSYIAYSDSGEMVLQRFGYGYDKWRQYQGGSAARLYYSDGKSDFAELPFENNNAYSPIFVGNKLFFLSDLSGTSNVYEYNLSEKTWKQKTHHNDFYIKGISKTDSDNLVYSVGGSIYKFNCRNSSVEHISVTGHDYHNTDKPFLSNIDSFHTSLSINDKGDNISFASRGYVFSGKASENSYLQYTESLRYRMSSFIDDTTIVAVKDNGDFSVFESYNTKTCQIENTVELEIGRVIEMEVFKTKVDKDTFLNWALIHNHRGQIILVDLNKNSHKVIVETKESASIHFDISPCKKWIAYSHVSKSSSNENSSICLYNIEKDEHHALTDGNFDDHSPSFTPDGKYIYFLSFRNIRPKYDGFYFSLYFKKNVSVYAFCLNNTVEHPFKPWLLKDVESKDDENKDSDSKDTESKEDSPNKGKEETVYPEILLNEMTLIKSDLPDGTYSTLIALGGSKLLLFSGEESEEDEKGNICLRCADLTSNQITTISSDIELFGISNNKEWMSIYYGGKFRITKAGEQFDDSDKSHKKGGFVDVSNYTFSIDARKEWANILYEAWWFLKENFWSKDIIEELKWDEVLKKYQSLLPMIKSREDLNFILEELCGETKTSHNYVYHRGENLIATHDRQGYLLADFKWNNGYEILKISQILDKNGIKASPLLEYGVNVSVGDKIIAIDGVKLREDIPIEQQLNCKGGKNVMLTVKQSDQIKNVCVKPIKNIKEIMYRDWVAQNKAYVDQKTNGKIGYIHIPDMGKRGFVEFHKAYNTEHRKDGLIIDNRYNAGGHVSSLLLQVLLNKQTGFQIFRDEIEEFPTYSNKGNLVLLVNENSGSDGDLFAYQFRKHGLGTIVGRRTWGGVVGILPKHRFIDHGLTSQAQYHITQDNIDLSIENKGVNPDIDIQNSIEDAMNNIDKQLDKAIEIAVGELKK